MPLQQELERQGNFLFRHRGTLPLLIVAAGIPVGYFTGKDCRLEVGFSWYEGLCLAVSLMGFFMRVFIVGYTPKGTSGRNCDAQVADELNTTGAYSVVRHPLYVANYFMWLGVMMMTYNIWFVLVVTLAYWIYYERIMFAEEQFLTRKYGDAYVQWATMTPAFIPKFSNWKKPKEKFNMRKVLRQEKNGLLALFILFAVMSAATHEFNPEVFHHHHKILLAGLAVSLLSYIVLKVLKYNTSVLNDRQ
jgi:protein-S-isoprenylcysteine O-methyltransferase Ste14